jgi:4-carboxymuconolactone decarboxylase
MQQARALSSYALIGLLLTVTTASAQMTDKPRRFSEYSYEQLDDKQKAVADVMKQKTLSGIGGPNNVLLRSPSFADNIMRMSDYLRYNSSVPRRLNELAILLVARHWNSQFEWALHVPAALKAGLAEALVNDLAEGRRPAVMQPDESIVYDFVTDLLTNQAVRDVVFAKAKTSLGEQRVVDLIGVTGFYVMLAMVLNTAEIPVPPAAAAKVKPFKPMSR